MGSWDLEARRAGLAAFFTGFLVGFFLVFWAIVSSRVLLSRWGIRGGGASGLSGTSLWLGAFGPQNDPPDRFDRLRRSGLTHIKKLGRGALDDTPGRRGLCLIHRVRPE